MRGCRIRLQYHALALRTGHFTAELHQVPLAFPKSSAGVPASVRHSERRAFVPPMSPTTTSAACRTSHIVRRTGTLPQGLFCCVSLTFTFTNTHLPRSLPATPLRHPELPTFARLESELKCIREVLPAKKRPSRRPGLTIPMRPKTSPRKTPKEVTHRSVDPARPFVGCACITLSEW